MRLALVSPIAESLPEAALLKQHGFTIRVCSAGLPAADIVLPTPKGGSLAYLCPSVQLPPIAQLVERAGLASRAARRCTVLVRSAVGDDVIEVLQNAWCASPPPSPSLRECVRAPAAFPM